MTPEETVLDAPESVLRAHDSGSRLIRLGRQPGNEAPERFPQGDRPGRATANGVTNGVANGVANGEVSAGDASAEALRHSAIARVPPVRTIVLDRAPMPAVAPHERQRTGSIPAAGPERLALEDVSIRYGSRAAVKSVSLPIHQGEVLALIGPSGCGKTTLLRSLNRLTELTPNASRSGRITLDGEEIDDLSDTRLRSRVAMVFQQPNPFPMSIFDNVAFGLREQARRRPRRQQLEPLVEAALKRAGLYDEVAEDLRAPALRLSGGQQQRLCIARAIAPRPEVLLMDEPCSALDPISTGVIEDLVHELRRELAVVMVTHNLAQAQRVADKVAFMYLGDLVEYGTAEQVFEQPRAQRTRDYVGGAFG